MNYLKLFNPAKRQIWALHCEGLPVREIADQLKFCKKSTVHQVIQEISSLIRRGPWEP